VVKNQYLQRKLIRLPLAIISHHRIQNGHHFSHAGRKCNFLVLTLLDELPVEFLHDRVALNRA
jgi:hypothetical protein